MSLLQHGSSGDPVAIGPVQHTPVLKHSFLNPHYKLDHDDSPVLQPAQRYIIQLLQC